jgi:hypothetical protein
VQLAESSHGFVCIYIYIYIFFFFAVLGTEPRAARCGFCLLVFFCFPNLIQIRIRIIWEAEPFFFFFLVFRDRVSLYSPSCPGIFTYRLERALVGLKLCRSEQLYTHRALPASVSSVLRLKMCATTPGKISPGCPGTHSVDQAGLELRTSPVSATTAQLKVGTF